jgi:hypothetical protein
MPPNPPGGSDEHRPPSLGARRWTRKGTLKSLTYPDLKVVVAGTNAIARHRYVSESELDGKTTSISIGILEVWTKQDGTWRLLARQGYKLA